MTGMPDRIAEGAGQRARIQASLEGTQQVVTLTASKTLTAEDSGKIFLIGTDALVITLPPTAEGLIYTFVNSGADGGAIITVSPAAADAIHGVFTLAASIVELSGTDNKDMINTKATAGTGDHARIVADGSVGWFVIGGSGIWASEA